MRDIINRGHLYAAIPPLYRAIYNKNQSIYLRDDNALQQWKNKNFTLNFELQRFKGWQKPACINFSNLLLGYILNIKNIIYANGEDDNINPVESDYNLYIILYYS